MIICCHWRHFGAWPRTGWASALPLAVHIVGAIPPHEFVEGVVYSAFDPLGVVFELDECQSLPGAASKTSEQARATEP